MSGIIANFHVAFALAAMILGMGIFTSRRGTPFHRKLGYAYITSMLVLNVSALLLFARTGTFGPFHIAALISLVTLMAGAVPAITRKPKNAWLALHWEFMSWSFVGLLAGAVAETAFRIPGLAYWPAIVVASLVTVFVGGVLIYGSRGAMRKFVDARQGSREKSRGRD
jgi:uncharacterized membrane protein